MDEPFNTTMFALGLTMLVLIAYDLTRCVTAARLKFADKELDDRLTEMERNIELLRYIYTMEESSSESSEPCPTPESQDESPLAATPETESHDETPTPSVAPQPTKPVEPTKPIATTPESDRHAALKRLLLNKEVYLTYKKQTFVARIADRPTAQHGYLIVCGNDEYNTPSHFSYAKKSTVNPNLHSDNGWDSIYVVTGTNAKDKQTKLSLKEFIAASAQGSI